MTEVRVEGVALEVNGDGELRIRDIDLGTQLGYVEPKKIRPLIKRHLDAGILRESEVRRTVGQTSPKGGRPAEEFWLTEEQAILIAAKSDTERAGALLRVVIHVFVLARRGLLAETGATEPLPPWLRDWTPQARAVTAEFLISVFERLSAIRTALTFEVGNRDENRRHAAVRLLEQVECLDGSLCSAARIFVRPETMGDELKPNYREHAARAVDGLSGLTYVRAWKRLTTEEVKP